MNIKLLINSLIQKAVYRYRATSESYVSYLKKIGVEIGEDVNFYAPTMTEVDIQNPHLIKIGSSVHIGSGVRIITHDFSWAVIKKVYGDVLGGEGEVYIGNNCVIGVNVTILKDTHIGDNVVIGANSLVHGNVPSNSVIAGSPAKVLMSLGEYYEKRKNSQDSELKMMIKDYYERFGVAPNIDVLSEYFWMFTNNPDDLTDKCIEQMRNCGNFCTSMELFRNHTPKYNSLEEAISSILSEKDV